MKKLYVGINVCPIPVNLEEELLQCSVRAPLDALDVEPYHDYFHESDPTHYNESDPFVITW